MAQPPFEMWREPKLLVVKLTGIVDDNGSQAWRDAVDAHAKERGYPPFMILDVEDAKATNSMSARLRSSSWARALLKNLQEGVIYAGKNFHSTFVIKAILRLVGMPNITIVGDPVALDAIVERWRAT